MVDKLGFIDRNDICWFKRSCMPESAKDRFTIDFEPIFMLTKNKKYYFERILEKLETEPHSPSQNRADESRKDLLEDRIWGNPLGRNCRTVWDICPQPVDWDFCFKCKKLFTGAARNALKPIYDDFCSQCNEATRCPSPKIKGYLCPNCGKDILTKKKYCSIRCRQRTRYYNDDEYKNKMCESSKAYYNKSKDDPEFKKKNYNRVIEWQSKNREKYNTMMRIKNYALYKKRLIERKGKGLCMRCGKVPHMPERAFCDICREYERLAYHKRKAKKKEITQNATNNSYNDQQNK